MNERVFLAQLESANADELAQILRRPNADGERLLEVYFGAERLQRLRALALTTQRRGLRAVSKGNLVVLHGIMGGELTVYPNVKTFWFDWRQDLAGVADNLRQQIDGWFGPSADVHLVAHSMGGLVSRTYILRHPDRWGKKSRLVMLGTPNHGSFAIPQVITGAYDTVRKLALLDLTHNLRDLCTILNSFPGSMQMLPSPLVQDGAWNRMY